MYQYEYFTLKKQMAEVYQKASIFKENHKHVKANFKSEIKKNLKEKEELSAQIDELKLMVLAMEQNKIQIKEIFDEKEIENQKLREDIDGLRAELSELKLCETQRFSDFNQCDTRKFSELRLSMTSGSFFQSKYLEYDNDRFFSKLLTCSEGILYKNHFIQIGISVKIEKKIGSAIIYIGNCKTKPITLLETTVESTDLKVEINKEMELSPILSGKQADRIIHFEFNK